MALIRYTVAEERQQHWFYKAANGAPDGVWHVNKLCNMNVDQHR